MKTALREKSTLETLPKILAATDEDLRATILGALGLHTREFDPQQLDMFPEQPPLQTEGLRLALLNIPFFAIWDSHLKVFIGIQKSLDQYQWAIWEGEWKWQDSHRIDDLIANFHEQFIRKAIHYAGHVT